MTRSWQQIKDDTINRAHLLFAEVVRIREQLPPTAMAEIMYSKIGDEDYTTTLCRYYMKKALSPDVKEITQATQVDGMFSGQFHSWLQVEPDEAAQQQEGLERIQPGWKYIIDVSFPETLPPVLMISPLAPILHLYQKQEDVDCPSTNQS